MGILAWGTLVGGRSVSVGLDWGNAARVEVAWGELVWADNSGSDASRRQGRTIHFVLFFWFF
jgi:hypothetical protein